MIVSIRVQCEVEAISEIDAESLVASELKKTELKGWTVYIDGAKSSIKGGE
jgi:hypothetical protein